MAEPLHTPFLLNSDGSFVHPEAKVSFKRKTDTTLLTSCVATFLAQDSFSFEESSSSHHFNVEAVWLLASTAMAFFSFDSFSTKKRSKRAPSPSSESDSEKAKSK